MPCNFNLRRLAAKVKEGIRAAGGTPMEFNTIAVSDGITMGTEGMKASLISREVIADSIELVARGHSFDAMVVLVGCDKTIPGAVMALARLDIPGLVLYGGSIMPGPFEGRDVTILDVFEAVGAHAAGKITDDELRALEDFACPGAGACGGQYTANTMAMAMEFMGMSPLGSASVPAMNRQEGRGRLPVRRAGHGAARARRPPRDIITRESIENAIAAVVRHRAARPTPCCTCWPSPARPASTLDIDDFDRISERTPLLADLKPGGQYVAADLYRAGGIRLVAQRLLEARLLHADCHDGHRPHHRRGGPRRASRRPASEVIRPVTDPIKPTGGLVILKGNLAPEGCVVKVAGLRAHAATAAQRASSTAKRTRWPPCSRRQIRPATSSSSATRGRGVGRACARCSASPAPSSARGWAKPSR